MTTMEMKIKQGTSLSPEIGESAKTNLDLPISVAAIITAAGSSTRMGGQKKEYRLLPNGRSTLLSAAVEVFIKSFFTNHVSSNLKDTHPYKLTQVVITVPPNSGKEGVNTAKEALFTSESLKKLWENTDNTTLSQGPTLLIVEGGESRQASVHKALEAINCLATKQKDPDIVLIHDGARPFVSEEIILQVTEATHSYGAAACGIPPVDTQKEVDSQGFIIRHLDRDALIAIQTPQGFKFKPLLEAHQLAAAQGFSTTDDTAIWGRYVGAVKITKGSIDNKKITFPKDLAPETNTNPGVPAPKEGSMQIRTGLGYDLHRLEEGRPLVLGGLTIPFHLGEAGHSDGDVLLHAITDALLGAAAISDIGELFPPSDSRWKGADSAKLLQEAWALVTKEGWKLENLDCVVAIQEPKILPHREAIIKNIASILDVEVSQVFIKAKTGEKLGPVGNSQAVEVWSTCLLSK